MRQLKHIMLKVYDGTGTNNRSLCHGRGGALMGEILTVCSISHPGENHRGDRNTAGPILLRGNANFSRAVEFDHQVGRTPVKRDSGKELLRESGRCPKVCNLQMNLTDQLQGSLQPQSFEERNWS